MIKHRLNSGFDPDLQGRFLNPQTWRRGVTHEQIETAIDEYLKRGGEIHQFPPSSALSRLGVASANPDRRAENRTMGHVEHLGFGEDWN